MGSAIFHRRLQRSQGLTKEGDAILIEGDSFGEFTARPSFIRYQ